VAQDPVSTLPPAFAAVGSLLDRMTIRQPNGSSGLLAKGQFGDAVTVELGKLGLDKEVKKVVDAGDQVRFLMEQYPQCQ
jgi:indoleamine 2,3-dioxygenase